MKEKTNLTISKIINRTCFEKNKEKQMKKDAPDELIC